MARKKRKLEPSRYSRVWVGRSMRCPNGHDAVYIKAGRHKGVLYLEADCVTCGARQRVNADEVPGAA